MGRSSRKRRERCAAQHSVEAVSCLTPDGIHAIMPGAPFSEAEVEKLTREYQRQLRNSRLWEEMLREFGEAKA